MKKYFVSLLTVLLVLCLFPMASFAAEHAPADGGTLYLSECTTGDTIRIADGCKVTLSGSSGTTYTGIEIICGEGVQLTLSSVNIDNSGFDNSCPLTFLGSNDKLILMDGTANTLAGGGFVPAVRVEDTAELEISGKGTLTATGGGQAAGIGSGDSKNAGSLTVTDGTVIANGGSGGAGIGGGSGGAGGNINISGGAVTATGGSGGGYDIGGGVGGAGGTLSVDGAVTLTLTGSGTNAAFTPGTCRITGTGAGSLSGFYVNRTKIPSDRIIDVSVASSGTGYTYSSPTFTINTNGEYLIWNATAANRIVVNPGVNADIILFGASIQLSSGCAFNMTGATVDMTLASNNTLKSGTGYAGLLCPSGATLTISGSGSLNATGGGNKAGLPGSGIGGSASVACGSITIKSGTVTATGGVKMLGMVGIAGIGGGVVTISGGNVTAVSCEGGYAIGNNITAGSSITITGGTVTATACYSSCGIGGKGTDPADITISGGNVTAIGDGFTPAIGGLGGALAISGGSVYAYNKDYGPGIAMNSGKTTISGGTVFAASGNPAVYHDIGGVSGSEGTLTITGGAMVFLKNNNCITPVTTHKNETFPAGTTEVYGEAISVPDTWTGGFGAYLLPCTLTYDSNGGSGTASAMTRLYGVTASAPDGGGLSRENYSFNGWNTAADGSGTNYAEGDTFTFTADTTLYAQWVACPALASSVESASIYTGGRIVLTPNIDGGTWNWDKTFFSATFNSPATFTGLKAGVSTITYTVDEQTASYAVTVKESELPSTGQDFKWAWLLGGLSAALTFALTIGLKKVRG